MKKDAKEVLKQFQCDYIRILEETFAQTLSENEQVRLFFINENQAFTDGRNIVVDPANDELFCDQTALQKTGAFLHWPQVVLGDMWNALRIITRAQTIHECLHILYTDFPPKAATEPLCDTKLKKKILAHIANIIEDAYIEAVGCSVYDNMEFYLRFGRVSRLFASHPSEGTAAKSLKDENQEADIDPAVKHQMALIMEFLNVMCTDLLYPMIEPDTSSEELKPYVEKAKPLYMQGSMAPSPDERYAFSKQVFEILLPFIPDIEVEIEDEKLKQRLGGEKTHDPSSSSIGTEPHKGRTQQVTIRLFTDEDGNKRDDLPSLDQIMATLAQYAKDKQIALSILMVEGQTIITHGSDYDCSVMHKGIKINELHPKVNLQLRKAYMNIYNKYRLNINSYNGRFAQILKAQVSYREDKYKFGSGILSTRLGDPQKRYWYRNVNGIDVPEMAILLLIDGSGSMHGMRQKSAMTSAVILHEVLKQQGILHAIVEHRAGFTEPEIDVNILVNFNAREEEKYNLMQSSAGGDNRDALALYWAERYIHRQSHADSRIIIVISDGVPAHDYDDYYPPVSTKDTANAVRKIMKRGTDIIAISLDDNGSYVCYDQLKEIYPNLIACNDLNRLTGQLLGLIAKLL
ncbi:MAG: hypothetical protein IJH64_14050 [Oscillospiraceae bacterium]|nr:hypothetical protein [Oscillospiraceae bacterium]